MKKFNLRLLSITGISFGLIALFLLSSCGSDGSSGASEGADDEFVFDDSEDDTHSGSDDADDDSADDDAASDDSGGDDSIDDDTADDDATDDDIDDTADDDSTDDDDTGIWVTEVIDTLGGAEFGTSIAVDSNGDPHISYVVGVAYYTLSRYTVKRDGIWSIQTISLPLYYAGDGSIGLDPDGVPHVAFMAMTFDMQGMLMNATNRSGSWAALPIAAGWGIGDVGLAEDSRGKSHITAFFSDYFHPSTPFVAYLTNRYGGFSQQTVGTGNIETTYTSIALDPSENPHIAYCSRGYLSYGPLYHVFDDGTGHWITETVSPAYLGGCPNSIAVAADGVVSIAYGGLDLPMFATNASGAWVKAPVDLDAGSGWFIRLAVDSAGHAHLSYYDSIAQSLKYATNRHGAWEVTVVDDAGDEGKGCSIAVDANRRPHISYIDATNNYLKYAHRE